MLIEIPAGLESVLEALIPETLSEDTRLLVPEEEWAHATAIVLLSRLLKDRMAQMTETPAEQEPRRGRGPDKHHLLDPHKDAVVSEIINNLADIKRATMAQIQEWALDAICRASPDSTCPVPSDYREKWVRSVVLEMRAAEIVVLNGSRRQATYELHTAKKPTPSADSEIPF